MAPPPRGQTPAPGTDRPPSRTVHHAEALAWLGAQGRLPGISVITSLPDVSEIPALTLPDWKAWFVRAAEATLDAVPEEGVAIFFQSDIKRDGWWIDKGALVAQAAARAGVGLLFHKIVCRKPPGTVTFGRAGYSHLLAFGRHPLPLDRHASADVLPEPGLQPGTKAMGAAACAAACRFVLAATTTRTILDPFCGFGTALAVANALGLDAIGVDLSTRMCRRARALQIDLATGAGSP